MMESELFRAMSTDIVLMAEAEPRTAALAFAEARRFIEASELRFTRFSESSELSELNRRAGRWHRASDELFEVVSQAMVYFERTGGLFDPSILPDLKRAGYDRSMDDIRRDGPGPHSETQAHHGSRFAGVELDPETRSVRVPFDVQIDLGGIAKGWIAEQAARVLRRHADACAANAGGDMFLIGHPHGQGYWDVGMENPWEPARDLALIHAQEGAIATTSVIKRRWRQGDAERHHVIDPRTGEPAETQWASITVLGPHAAEAEAFAKAFLLACREDAGRLAGENPHLTVLGVSAAGELVSLSERAGVLHVAA